MERRNYWQRMRRSRMSRRALLRASGRAGVGAAGLALVGCGGDDDDEQQAVSQAQQQQDQDQPQAQQQGQQQVMQQQQTDQQAERQAQQQVQQETDDQNQVTQQQQVQAVGNRQYGGNYSLYTPANWDGFDPHRTNLAHPFHIFNDSMGRLVEIYNNAGPVYAADLASLPEVPDEETYIFRIDQGARFWDRYPTEGGRLFTSEDAAANIQRQIDALDADGVPDARFTRQSIYSTTASTDIPDDMTLVCRTAGPDATYLEAVHMQWSFMTSIEAMELWGQAWIDEQTNVELVSGCGPFIPTIFEPEGRLHLERNPNYWKSLDGQQMPFLDSLTWVILSDQTAVETAYRNGDLDEVSLNSIAIEGIEADFPEHTRFDRGVVLPLMMRFNYNQDWDDNPWLDRRVPYAFHVAMDRDAIIDAIYFGKGKPSTIQHLNWYHGWAIDQETTRTLPGYRPDKDADIQMARELLSAAGVEEGTEYPMIVADIFEGLYPGASELYRNMYENALGIKTRIELLPYDGITQRLIEGTYPGSFPIWVGAGTGDPTSAWNSRYVPGGGENWEKYDFQPITDIVTKMKVTLDADARREMAQEVSWILLGEDERYGLDGLAPSAVMGNGIDTSIYWPYLNVPERSLNVWEREGWHWRKEVWMDTTHPDFPGDRA